MNKSSAPGSSSSNKTKRGPVDSSTVLISGDWEHRMVAANGHRFHVALTGPDDGDAPLIVLLHGFPQFWWAWRSQLLALGDAGFRTAAIDLRGYGASDKPPEGYDLYALTSDIAGIIRSLGESKAIIIGHGVGGAIAWSMPTLAPDVVTSIVPIASAHPGTIRGRLGRLTTPGARRSAYYVQLPWAPESSLQKGMTTKILRAWGATSSWLDDEVAEQYFSAIRVPFVAHSALEFFRWIGRSIYRPDGRRFTRKIRTPITVPVLQLHGDRDRCIPARTAKVSKGLVTGPYEFRTLPGVGHWVPEEDPTALNEILLDWLS